MKTHAPLMKAIFVIYLVLLVIVYLFFDDGGIATKSFYDFLFIPIVSSVIASVLTLVTYFPIYMVKSQLSSPAPNRDR